MQAFSNFSLRIPTLHTLTRSDNNSCELLDAIYVPTQSHRPPLYTDPLLLKNHTKRIFLLFSHEQSEWSKYNSELFSSYSDIASYFDISGFNSLQSSQNPSTSIMEEYDIPAKRNYALLHASENGFRRIGLLDDDIKLSDDNLWTARLSIKYNAPICSFFVLDYPDVSTIDHIQRIVEGKPANVSIGGNCLFFDLSCVKSFFPRIYNDDWFFIFSHLIDANVVSGGIAFQRPYKPWVTPRRVEFEQFGDIIIEGAKRNISEYRNPFSGDSLYWDCQIDAYMQRLEFLKASSCDEEMLDCVERAIATTSKLTSQSMVNFLGAYILEQRENKYARSSG